MPRERVWIVDHQQYRSRKWAVKASYDLMKKIKLARLEWFATGGCMTCGGLTPNLAWDSVNGCCLPCPDCGGKSKMVPDFMVSWRIHVKYG